MKCQVVVDERGNVISISYKGLQVEESEQQPTLNSGPVIEEKWKLVELDITDEYVKKPTAEILKLIQRDFQTKKEL